MNTVSYYIPNISCGHCVHTINMEVGELEGVTTVQTDQEAKIATITFGEPATEDKILSLLAEINYPAVEMN